MKKEYLIYKLSEEMKEATRIDNELFPKFDVKRGLRNEDGIGVIGAYTVGQETRMIGNLTETSADFGKIIGYENHSGQTFLRDGVQPLGTVEQDGTGNNGEDHTEGARVHNVIGTYMHGSLLPKNPAIADFLIRTAVERRYGTFDPAAAGQTDAQRAALHRIDEIADRARRVAMSRPR